MATSLETVITSIEVTQALSNKSAVCFELNEAMESVLYARTKLDSDKARFRYLSARYGISMILARGLLNEVCAFFVFEDTFHALTHAELQQEQEQAFA